MFEIVGVSHGKYSIFSKILDINQCTMMNFDSKKMYHFIGYRFKRTSAKVQGQALSWLQVKLKLSRNAKKMTDIGVENTNIRIVILSRF